MATSAKRTPKRRKITDADLFNLRIATNVSIAPDESKIAYTVERIDEKENTYFQNIFLADLRIGQTRQFTFGNQADQKPAWSPDGRQLAFVSVRDKKTGVYLMPVEGGSERKIIELDGALGDLIWHPNGKQLVFALRYNDSHFIEDEKKKKEAPVYRHITKLWYRLDGLGFLPQDTFQVYVLDIKDASLRKLTPGNRDNHSPALSHDGKWVCYISNRRRNPDIDSLYDDLFMIPFAGGKEKLIPTPFGPVGGPRFSPDGKYIAYIGHDDPNDPWGVRNRHIWLVKLGSKGPAKDLMRGFDRMAADQSISDTADVHDSGTLFWSGDSRRIFFLSSDDGNTNLYYVPRGGGKPTRIFKGDCHIKGLAINGKGNTAGIIYADINNPGDIMAVPTQYGGEKRTRVLTDLNPFLRSEVKLGKTKVVTIKSFDGTEVTGWLLTPPDFNPNKKYPSILEVHGGPRVQYAHTFFHEMQFLAANGYVVLYTNPRGGAGKGETWADAIAGGWGDLDYKDCMAATDWLEKQRFIDKKRMGITGGSYGGYMTNWVITQTNRFKAAVTQRSVVDLVSFVGSSDFGYSLDREFNGYPWTNMANYIKCSPIYHMEKVRTPVLILHNEQDLRCGIEQAEQMFAKLKILGKTVEFVRFPEEPHGLSRHGRPDRRRARLQWIVKWMDKYLRK